MTQWIPNYCVWSLILRFRRGHIYQILQSRPFMLRRQLLIPYFNRRWVSFIYPSSLNDLKTCQRADIVENQRCGETSSLRRPRSLSRPIIKTLLKYQCPGRNEYTSFQKWATDIKDTWGCSRFHNSVNEKWSLPMVMWFKVLVLFNFCGTEYIPAIRPALKMTFPGYLWNGDLFFLFLLTLPTNVPFTLI